MKKTFAYDSYKHLILDKISALPDQGRGVMQRLSEHMRVNPSFVSQVLKGDKHFSLEQAYSLASFFALNNLERDFLLALLQLERAGTHELKMYFEVQLAEIRKKSKFVSKRLSQKTILREQDQARYYSDWIYSAIRIFCTQKNITLNDIRERFDLNAKKISEIVSFLIDVGLLLKDGAYLKAGVTNTHLPANSPFVVSHHKNWRVRAINKHTELAEDELAFTAPFGVSKSDFHLIKEEILELIARVSKRVNDSPTEELACLNIDLFII